jgi:hypothetical protein
MKLSLNEAKLAAAFLANQISLGNSTDELEIIRKYLIKVESIELSELTTFVDKWNNEISVLSSDAIVNDIAGGLNDASENSKVRTVAWMEVISNEEDGIDINEEGVISKLKSLMNIDAELVIKEKSLIRTSM